MNKLKFKSKTTIKRRELIWLEYANMLSEYGNEKKIFITDLCKRINMHRVSFYRYYKSIHEIPEDIKSSILNNFFKKIIIKSIDDINDFFNRIEEYLIKYGPIFSKLLSNRKAIDFVYELSKMTAQKVLSYLSNYTNVPINDWVELEISTFNSGLFTQLILYFTKKTSKSLQQILKYGRAITLQEIAWMSSSEYFQKMPESNKQINS